MLSPFLVLKVLRRLLLAAAISSGLIFAPIAAAATYGYAPTAYSWVDNTAHTDVTWAHAAGCSGGWNGTNVDDDVSTQIALPFTFTFGATAFNYVQVMSNGRLQFVASAAGTSYCGYGTQTVGPPPTYPYPYPDANLNNSMRLYGADLCPAGGGAGCTGRVTYKALGVAPYRTFVVSWTQVTEWNSGASLFNMQAILYENGDFVYQYKNVANYSHGTGQIGWQLSTTNYDLVDLTSISSLAYSAIRFYKPTAPIAEYRLDECTIGGANSVIDSGPNALHGQPTGSGFTAGVAGEICSAYSFDGSNNGYIRVNNAAVLNQNYVSVSAWARHSTSSYKGWETILAKGDTTYRLHLNGGCSISPSTNGYTTANAFTFGFNGGCGNADLNSGIVPVAGQWYHVVGTYDGVTIKIFVNGVLANSAALATTIGSNTYPLYIGENSQAPGREWTGTIDEVKIFDRALPDNEVYSMYLNESAGLQRDGTIRTCTICGANIGWFNAYESSLPTTTLTGPIKTKIAGKVFSASSGSVAISQINAPRTAVDTSSTRPVRVEFWDATGETGTADSFGCYSTSKPTPFYTQNIAALASGRFVIDPTVAEAYKRVRVRMTDTGTGGQNGRYGCSTDLFAIRPAYLDVSAAAARDTDWRTAGAGRALTSSNTSAAANASLTANTDRVHAAGRPFSISGLVAKNGAATPVTTANYDGQPTLIPGSLILPDPNVCITCAPGAFSAGSWVASSGSLSTTTASYSEAGSFSWEVEDRSFASVDASDSTKSQRYILSNQVISTGRFVPDSFQLTLNSPTLQTFGASDAACSATAPAPKRSFTYLGQPFGYATAPSVGVAALNSGGSPLVNYQGTPGSGGLWRLATPLASSSVACTAPTQTCALTRQDGTAKTRLLSTYALGAATPGWDGSLGTVANVTITSNNNGTGTMAYGADKLALYRNPTTPQAAYTAAVTLALQLDDFSEAAVSGNPAAITGNLAATAIPFDTAPVAVLTGEFRYGVLRTQSNFGSELLDLPIAVQTQYWNGTGFVQNTADNCTPLAASNIALVNYQGALNAANMGASHVAITTPITAGAGVITLAKPTGGARGSVDTVVNLGSTGAPANCPNYSTAGSTSAAMRYLSGIWCGTNYDRDPTGRATFGSTRTPLIYRRENY